MCVCVQICVKGPLKTIQRGKMMDDKNLNTICYNQFQAKSSHGNTTKSEKRSSCPLPCASNSFWNYLLCVENQISKRNWPFIERVSHCHLHWLANTLTLQKGRQLRAFSPPWGPSFHFESGVVCRCFVSVKRAKQ